MGKHVMLSAILAVSAVVSLLSGCGDSPRVYTLSSLNPSEVVAGSTDFPLKLTGTNFTSKTRVLFAGATLVPSSFTTSQLVVTVPASAVSKAGVIDVAVTGSATSSALKFTINNPAPVLKAISQESVLLNSSTLSVDITGSSFVSTSTVKFGDKSLTPKSVTPTQLTVDIPDTSLTVAQTLAMAVVNPSPGGGTSTAISFSVLNPVPVISSLSLDNTLVNSEDFTLSLLGTGFAPGMTVRFGGVSLVPVEVTPTQASVLVPKGAVGTGAVLDVMASNAGPGGGASNAMKFTVNNPLPALASLSVSKTLVNSSELTLDILGTGFVPGVTVTLGSATLTPTSVTPTQISILVPKEALAKSGVLSLSVANISPGGGMSNALEFTVENPAPILTSISLEKIGAGSADFALTLSGSEFIPASAVGFGSVALTPTASSATELTVTVPASALVDGGSYPVMVKNEGPGGGASSALQFTVENPAPVLTALSQKSTVLNSTAFTLTLTGTGFAHQSAVTFGSIALVPTAYSPTSLSVLVPDTALTKSGPLYVSVTNPSPGGGASDTLRFIVENPVPAVTTASPTSLTTSTTDSTVTLLGTGFVEGTTVTLGTETLIPTSIKPNAITLSVPSTQIAAVGTITFSVTNPEPGGGQSNTVTVTIHGKAPATWRTVVNNKMTAPDSTSLYQGYNQPSVNTRGVVVFKGQTKADSGPTVGIYTRDMSAGGMRPITKVTDNKSTVPQPNNTSYNSALATFIQFPSFPRIDRDSDTVGFRGQSQPVWTYTLADGTETRVGSTGIFSNPVGPLMSGTGLMGLAPGFEYLQVPGAPTGTRFDQFPGSPAVTGNSTVVFKGNYTVDGGGKTGVFFRDFLTGEGKSPVTLIANSSTLIPGQPEGGTVVFGSTAPPSAANGEMVFLGLDNEDEPTMGGIYKAPLLSTPALETLVQIGAQVPGEADGLTFTRLGEGLSFDGRYVAFWGAWGSATRTRLLICATDGNKDMIASCNEMYPDGYEAEEPALQGIFVYDTTTKTLYPVAKNNNGEFDDFVYWVFSGRPPNVGSSESDEIPEPPRWRSSAFVSVAGSAAGAATDAFAVTFKAGTGSVDGIYLAQGPTAAPILTVIDTSSNGTDLDPEAPAGSTLSTVGMERDGLRSDWLVVTSSMLDPLTTESGAGVYITEVKPQ
ncbi:MAG: IPT/TIG domain-containing protein [Terracidiphilus sp.]